MPGVFIWVPRYSFVTVFVVTQGTCVTKQVPRYIVVTLLAVTQSTRVF
jgi:hypothetical protein